MGGPCARRRPADQGHHDAGFDAGWRSLDPAEDELDAAGDELDPADADDDADDTDDDAGDEARDETVITGVSHRAATSPASR